MKALSELIQGADIVFVPLSPLLAPAFDKMFQIGQQKEQAKASKQKKSAGPLGAGVGAGIGTTVGAIAGGWPGALVGATAGTAVGGGVGSAFEM